MAINTLATATLFMTQLDKIAVQEATTGWMDANAGQVIYNGGAEVKIPKMNIQGMGDYDREAGYQWIQYYFRCSMTARPDTSADPLHWSMKPEK